MLLLAMDGSVKVSIEDFDKLFSEVSLSIVADLILEVFYEKLLF